MLNLLSSLDYSSWYANRMAENQTQVQSSLPPSAAAIPNGKSTACLLKEGDKQRNADVLKAAIAIAQLMPEDAVEHMEFAARLP